MYDEDNNVMWTRSVTNQRGYQIKSLVEKDNGAAREEERDRTRSKASLAHLFNT
jgi:hypothetical protein